MAKPTTVAEYLETVPPPARPALDEVRQAIVTALPGTDEVVSYSIIGFRLRGKVVAYAAGWAHHVSVYPVHTANEALTAELAPYLSGKSTAKFPLTEAVPVDLISRLVVSMATERGLVG